jgi:hypothetical protein
MIFIQLLWCQLKYFKIVIIDIGLIIKIFKIIVTSKKTSLLQKFHRYFKNQKWLLQKSKVVTSKKIIVTSKVYKKYIKHYIWKTYVLFVIKNIQANQAFYTIDEIFMNFSYLIKRDGNTK